MKLYTDRAALRVALRDAQRCGDVDPVLAALVPKLIAARATEVDLLARIPGALRQLREAKP